MLIHITQNAHTDSINVLIVEERILFSGSEEMVIKLWDLDSKQHLNTLDHFGLNIKDMLIIEETGHLVSCSFDGKIFIWDYPHSSCVGVRRLFSFFSIICKNLCRNLKKQKIFVA